MEIGPIPAMRPVAADSSSRQTADLGGVVQAEFRKQDREETYTPHKKASRGLEDEESGEESAEERTEESAESLEEPRVLKAEGSISFFA